MIEKKEEDQKTIVKNVFPLFLLNGALLRLGAVVDGGEVLLDVLGGEVGLDALELSLELLDGRLRALLQPGSPRRDSESSVPSPSHKIIS